MPGWNWKKWSRDPYYHEPEGVQTVLRGVLEPGERVSHAFHATSGPRGTRWMGRNSSDWVGSWDIPPPVAYVFGVRNYVVAVTDRAVVVVRITLFIGTPKGIVARLPRVTRLGPFRDNGVITVAGIEMFVWGVSDLDAVRHADAEIGYDCPGPPSVW